MQGITFIQCTSCPNQFRKGTGHLVACCCGTKPICDDCYKRLKVEGKIKDAKFKDKDLSPGVARSMR